MPVMHLSGLSRPLEAPARRGAVNLQLRPGGMDSKTARLGRAYCAPACSIKPVFQSAGPARRDLWRSVERVSDLHFVVDSCSNTMAPFTERWTGRNCKRSARVVGLQPSGCRHEGGDDPRLNWVRLVRFSA